MISCCKLQPACFTCGEMAPWLNSWLNAMQCHPAKWCIGQATTKGVILLYLLIEMEGKMLWSCCQFKLKVIWNRCDILSYWSFSAWYSASKLSLLNCCCTFSDKSWLQWPYLCNQHYLYSQQHPDEVLLFSFGVLPLLAYSVSRLIWQERACPLDTTWHYWPKPVTEVSSLPSHCSYTTSTSTV